MKKLKLNIMAIIGMMVAVGTVAFTAPAEKTVYNAAAETWFYQSQNTSASDLNNPLNYSRTPLPETECEGEEVVCTILDVENPNIPGQPQLSHGSVAAEPAQYQITKRMID